MIGEVAVRRRQAGGLAIGAAAPLLELRIAVGTGTAVEAARVVARILVQGYLVAAVVVAEYVATLAAMVAAREVGEVPLASCVIADGGFLVGLQTPELARMSRRGYFARAHSAAARYRSGCTSDRAVALYVRHLQGLSGTYLPVLPSGRPCGFREQVEIPVAVDTLATVASRSPAQPAQRAQATQPDEAAVRP